MISEKVRTAVRIRAEERCEFCNIRQAMDPFFRFHIEHIIPRQHGGSNELENLALACYYCNTRKGSNLAGIDPHTGLLTPLFHPRLQRWSEHFSRNGAVISGITAVGRATVLLLKMNHPDRLRLRE